jgi:hypothetical protein
MSKPYHYSTVRSSDRVGKFRSPLNTTRVAKQSHCPHHTLDRFIRNINALILHSSIHVRHVPIVVVVTTTLATSSRLVYRLYIIVLTIFVHSALSSAYL